MFKEFDKTVKVTIKDEKGDEETYTIRYDKDGAELVLDDGIDKIFVMPEVVAQEICKLINELNNL